MSSKFRLSVGNNGKAGPADFSGRVNGVPSEADDSFEWNDKIDGGNFEGHVDGGWDHLHIAGEILAFDLDGPAQVLVDGVPVSASDVAGIGYAGPTPPKGYAGPGSAAWGDGAPQSDAQQAPTTDDPPASQPKTVALDNVGQDEAFGAGAFHEVPNPEPRDGYVSRYATTARDLSIEIDENDPGEWQRVRNLLPYRIEHNVKLVPTAGTHEGNGSSIRTGPTQVTSRGRLYVEGPGHGQCRVTSGVNGTFGVTKQEHNKISGVHYDGLSQFAGPVDLRDCRFSGFSKPGVNSTGTAAISGKNGQVHAKRCIIGDPSDDYGIWATLQERYSLTDCVIRGRVASVNRAHGCDFSLSRCEFGGPRQYA